MKLRMPLPYVKPFCMAAVLLGIFFLARGNWACGLCMLLGSYLFEKSMYRCPHCGKRLDMKAPLFKEARCPGCAGMLRQSQKIREESR